MRTTSCLLLFFLAALPLRAQTPAPTQADLEKLVQQEKWTEAAQAVDTLLKASPDDATLKGYKDEITKHLIATTPPLVPAPTATPVLETQLNSEDRLEWNTLALMAKNSQTQTNPAEKKRALQDILDKSAPFAAKHPGYLPVWQLRAAAALELDQSKTGWEAGQKLQALGALDSQDAGMMELMANLNLKGWLAPTYADVEKAQQATIAKTEEENKKKWTGTWAASASGPISLTVGQMSQTGTIDYSYSLTVEKDFSIKIKEEYHEKKSMTDNGQPSYDQTSRSLITTPGDYHVISTAVTYVSYVNGGNVDKILETHTIEKTQFLSSARILNIQVASTDAQSAVTKYQLFFVLDPEQNRVIGPITEMKEGDTADSVLKTVPDNPIDIKSDSYPTFTTKWLKKQ